MFQNMKMIIKLSWQVLSHRFFSSITLITKWKKMKYSNELVDMGIFKYFVSSPKVEIRTIILKSSVS